jgi:hypothetical protein
MKKTWFSLTIIGVLLTGCSAGSNLPPVITSSGPASQPTPTAPALTTGTVVVLEPTVYSTTPIPPPTFTGDPDSLRRDLAKAIASPGWATLGLPEAQAAKWQAFADSQGQLSTGEKATLADFLAQWKTLNALTAGSLVPPGADLQLRAKSFTVSGGGDRVVLYGQEGSSAQPRLFLKAHDRNGKAVALVLAPAMDRLHQEIGPDGEYVLYLDARGRTLLYADARPLDPGQPKEKALKDRLDGLYGDGDYATASIYPRFFYPAPGVQAGFYAIDQTLTYPQVLLLREALDLFDRPVLAPFKPEIFASGIAYLVVERISEAAGLTYTGTDVVELNRRDLFGNKYDLASVIAHEGSHVLQGGLKSGDGCDAILRREIGDGTIPQGFSNWTAEQVLEAVKALRIGAYHVSLWTLTKLGIQDVGWVAQAIRTGKVNGQSVVTCK